MGVYELLWGLGAAALLIALASGAARYRRASQVDDDAASGETNPERQDKTPAP